MTTSAPAPAKPSATARPIPRLPPVTSATLPLRSKSSSTFFMNPLPSQVGKSHVVALHNMERPRPRSVGPWSTSQSTDQQIPAAPRPSLGEDGLEMTLNGVFGDGEL